jgi:hypothetical protein
MRAEPSTSLALTMERRIEIALCSESESQPQRRHSSVDRPNRAQKN